MKKYFAKIETPAHNPLFEMEGTEEALVRHALDFALERLVREAMTNQPTTFIVVVGPSTDEIPR